MKLCLCQSVFVFLGGGEKEVLCGCGIWGEGGGGLWVELSASVICDGVDA